MAAESELEHWCRAYAEERGALLVKWIAPGTKGVPDRILLMTHRVVFIEFKAPRGRLSTQQKQWAARLRGFELNYAVVCNREHFVAIFDDRFYEGP